MSNVNYQYTIIIRQKAFVDYKVKISLELAGLLDYLMRMCLETNPKIQAERKDGFTWVGYNKILSDMPLLTGRSPASMTNKIDRLEKLGLINTKIISKRGKPRKFIKLTKLSKDILDSGVDVDEKKYNLFISMGMNEGQARILASDKEFLEKGDDMIDRTIRGNKENKAGYIWERYQSYLNNLNIGLDFV